MSGSSAGRLAEMRRLEETIENEPGQAVAQLKLGRFKELRGAVGEAGRGVDGVLDMLASEGDLSPSLLGQILKNVGLGSDAMANRQRLDRLLEVVDAVEVRTSVAPRFAAARARVLLALGEQRRFVEVTRTASRRWPKSDRLRVLDSMGRRWLTMGEARGPSKVFVIGLSRTGTTSMHRALSTLGFQSIHWDNPLTGRLPGDVDLHLFDAFGDINITARFEALSFRFPDARFILTERPLPQWVRSVSTHYHQRKGVCSPGELGDDRFVGQHEGQLGEIHGSLYAGHASWADAYASFSKRVDAHFGSHPDGRLLRFSVTEGDGWAPLVAFLGLPAPDPPFPHANRALVSDPVKGVGE